MVLEGLLYAKYFTRNFLNYESNFHIVTNSHFTDMETMTQSC